MAPHLAGAGDRPPRIWILPFVNPEADASVAHLEEAIPALLAVAISQSDGMGYEVKVNDPYKGVELVRAFSDPADGRHSLQVELNRRLYLDERTGQKTPGFARLARDIERLVKAVCDYAAERGSHRCAAGHDPHDHDGCHHDHGHGHHHGHGHDHAHGHAHGHDHDHDHDHAHEHSHDHSHSSRKDEH